MQVVHEATSSRILSTSSSLLKHLHHVLILFLIYPPHLPPGSYFSRLGSLILAALSKRTLPAAHHLPLRLARRLAARLRAPTKHLLLPRQRIHNRARDAPV